MSIIYNTYSCIKINTNKIYIYLCLPPPDRVCAIFLNDICIYYKYILSLT